MMCFLLSFDTRTCLTVAYLGQVENVAEVVEKVASVAEKVSGEVADVLPEGSKLKDAAQLVEYVSKEAEKDAHLILKLIHKVQVHADIAHILNTCSQN